MSGKDVRNHDGKQPQSQCCTNPSSVFASLTEAVIGSSVMPLIGQLPGSFRTISGCIGQVY